MTPEEQRIAIAEVCGWKYQDVEDGQSFSEPKRMLYVKRWVSPNGHPQLAPPDYLNDLNAMHEAEKILTDEQYLHHYLPQLRLSQKGFYWRVESAMASQRAEAFLRTIGKWKE